MLVFESCAQRSTFSRSHLETRNYKYEEKTTTTTTTLTSIFLSFRFHVSAFTFHPWHFSFFVLMRTQEGKAQSTDDNNKERTKKKCSFFFFVSCIVLVYTNALRHAAVFFCRFECNFDLCDTFFFCRFVPDNKVASSPATT